MNDKKIKIAFFGTPEFSAKILEKMKQEDFKPSLVIATPDKPKGRNLVLTPPATKIWAEKVDAALSLIDKNFGKNLNFFVKNPDKTISPSVAKKES